MISAIALIIFPTKGVNAFKTVKADPTSNPTIEAIAPTTPPAAPVNADRIDERIAGIPVLFTNDEISPTAVSIKSQVPSNTPANIPIN